MSKNGVSVEDLLNNYQGQMKVAGMAGANEDPVNPIKVAAEAGAREAETMVKTAAALGSLIGQSVYESLVANMGYDAEVAKTASFQDILTDMVIKVAEDIQGNAAQGLATADAVTELQVGEAAAHHANMAVTCASDAVQSASAGDNHTCNQMLESAAAHLDAAADLAQRSQKPEVHSHVAEAHQAVDEAVSQVQGITGGAQ